MCRLLAYSGNLSAKELEPILISFSKLSKDGCVPCGIESGHLDGWGIYGSTQNKELFYKTTQPPEEKDLFKSIDPILENDGQFIVHLRKATVGANYTSNTHPFVRAGIGFCHNGSIKIFPHSEFENDLHLREGHTDSETFFLRILDRIEGQLGDASLDNIKKALEEEIDEIKNEGVWTSLICLIKAKDGIILNYLWNESHKEAKVLDFEKYYSFYIGKKDNKTIMCSEKIEAEGFVWEKLKNNSIVILSSESL